MKKILFILMISISSFASTYYYPSCEIVKCTKDNVNCQYYPYSCNIDYFAPIDPYIDYY
jgi:hypothetical protein